jgi:uncharacterized protein YndB with AHSA1/START domain
MARDKLVIKKLFRNVAPPRLYAAWTDPQTVARWYGPEGFVNTIHEMELREGGRYRLTMTAPDGTRHPLSGSYRLLDRPNRIVLSWTWEKDAAGNAGRETLVTVTFRAVGSDTEMVLTHEGFASTEEVETHNQGWTGAFNKLAETLRR